VNVGAQARERRWRRTVAWSLAGTLTVALLMVVGGGGSNDGYTALVSKKTAGPAASQAHKGQESLAELQRDVMARRKALAAKNIKAKAAAKDKGTQVEAEAPAAAKPVEAAAARTSPQKAEQAQVRQPVQPAVQPAVQGQSGSAAAPPQQYRYAQQQQQQQQAPEVQAAYQYSQAPEPQQGQYGSAAASAQQYRYAQQQAPVAPSYQYAQAPEPEQGQYASAAPAPQQLYQPYGKQAEQQSGQMQTSGAIFYPKQQQPVQQQQQGVSYQRQPLPQQQQQQQQLSAQQAQQAPPSRVAALQGEGKSLVRTAGSTSRLSTKPLVGDDSGDEGFQGHLFKLFTSPSSPPQTQSLAHANNARMAPTSAATGKLAPVQAATPKLVVPEDNREESGADLADKGLFALWSKAGESSDNAKSGGRSSSGSGKGAIQDLTNVGYRNGGSGSDYEKDSSIYALSSVGKAGKASSAVTPDATADYYGIPEGGAAVPV